MTDARVILITGVAGYWGARVAARLAGQPEFHVIGLDVEPPQDAGCQGLDFIQADVRNSLLSELLVSENVDTVCHLSFVESARPSESSFDANVMGTMKVCGACAQAGVRKVVLKSSTAVYGARPDNSAFLTEEHPLRGSQRYGYSRDLLEIEAFANGFRGQVPQIALTVLRFPGVVGPQVDTPMTRFLRQPWTPVLLGFDPLMQVIHEDDVVEALVHSTVDGQPGVFNVAAEGILPLSKLMALAGKIGLPVFHLFAYWGVSLLGGTGLGLGRHVPIELDYIRYPWVADLTKMREVLGFTPHYTAEEALREFAGRQRLSRYMSDSAALAYDEERLRDTVERRSRARSRYEGVLVDEEGEEDDD
jgi:UDP-glucose 4-epimerase